MIAVIINIFPGLNPKYLLWEISFKEFFLWYERAMELKTGEFKNKCEIDIKKIKEKFSWDEKNKRWK